MKAMMTRRNEHGAAAVELAIILPILVMLLFGIIQFSVMYNRQQGLHAAAREGARVASLPNTTSTEIAQRVDDALEGVFKDEQNYDIEITLDGGAATSQPCDQNPGKTVGVKVTYDTDIDIPFWVSPTVTLTGRGEFRCE